METVISFLQCIYLAVWHAFGKNTLYLWTYRSSITSEEFDTLLFWIYSTTTIHQTAVILVFIIKIMLLQLVDGRVKPIHFFTSLYMDTKKPDASSRRVWLQNVITKICMYFIFLTMFPENNLDTLLCNTLELLVEFDRLLPIVINAVPIPTKQKVEVDTSVCMVFADAIRS